MKYLAILGRQPKLSLAELEAVLGPDRVHPWGGQALIDQSIELKCLGGTVKIAEVISQQQRLDGALVFALASHLKRLDHDKKLVIGLSLYGHGRLNLLSLSMELKKLLKTDRSVRLVLAKPGQTALTAAQLKFNHCHEVILVQSNGRVVVGITRQYQDVDAYSARDYDRPVRSGKVGMLPPKLAQILINLAGLKSGTILDPFCGSGVILQEGRLMGYKVKGSDLDAAMVAAATANMVWLSGHFPDLPSWEVTKADARSIQVNQASHAIITENYLGPAFSRPPNPTQLQLADSQVSKLTSEFLANLKTSSIHDFPIVICLPEWQTTRGPKLPKIVDEIPRLGYTLRQFAHVDYRELVYKRSGQTVGRKILVMRQA